MNSKKLRALSNDAIVERLDELDGLERSNVLESVFLLAEMGRRDHHLKLGFGSLFAYCFERLGQERSFAYRRSTAANLINRFPVIAGYLRDGRLSITTLVPLRKVLKPETHLRILDQASGLSEQQIKRLVASLAPRSVSRDVVRRIPARVVETLSTNYSAESKPELLPSSIGDNSAGGNSTGVAAAVASKDAGPLPRTPELIAMPPPRPRLEPLCAEFTRIGFSADSAFMSLLEQTRAALSHTVADGDLQEVFRESMRLALEAVSRRRLGARSRSIDFASTQSNAITDSTSVRSTSASSAHDDDSEGSASTSALSSSSPVSVLKPDEEIPSAGRPGSASPVSVLTPIAAAAGSAEESWLPGWEEDFGTAGFGSKLESVPGTVTGLVGGYVSLEVRVFVWNRDGGCCAFEGPDGHRCRSRWQVEFGHIVAFALGGAPTAANIRLVCRSHNQHEARVDFGAEFMNQFGREG